MCQREVRLRAMRIGWPSRVTTTLEKAVIPDGIDGIQVVSDAAHVRESYLLNLVAQIGGTFGSSCEPCEWKIERLFVSLD